MSIRDNEILDVTPKKLNRTESLYVVNVFKGLGTTLRHAFAAWRPLAEPRRGAAEPPRRPRALNGAPAALTGS